MIKIAYCLECGLQTNEDEYKSYLRCFECYGYSCKDCRRFWTGGTCAICIDKAIVEEEEEDEDDEEDDEL